MELVLVLVLLWMGQGILIVNMDTHVAAAAVGALVMGLLQLSALWFFRRSLPQTAMAAIRHIPNIGVLARWVLFAVSAGGLLQLVSFHMAPTLDLPLQPWTQQWAGWLVVALIAPLVEEILFRACIFELLRPKFSTITTLLMPAAIFGLAHSSLMGMALAFCGGILFGIAYLRSGSILPGFIGHAVVNTMGLWAIRNGAG